MKEISVRLGAEDWSLIDATLSQFGLPQTSSWDGSKPSYVLRMIDGAEDETLSELAQHVGAEIAGAPAPRVEPPFWKQGMFRMFISHLAAHKVQAAALQEALLEFGISGFVAHNDIEPTQEWMTQIEMALATCDGLLALLHPQFHASHWTDQEIGFAMGRGVPVLSVRLGQDPYGFIGRFQAFNGVGTARDLTSALFDALRNGKQTRQRMADVIVTLFEQSDSFAEAKQRMRYVEELTHWEPSFAHRLTTAADSNAQIQGSWGVPERVEALLKKRAGS